MSDTAADLHTLNVTVSDMAATLAFYWRLGLPVPEDQDSAAVHVQLRRPGGFSLELDTAESARRRHADWRADPASVGVVVGFALASGEAVDERYAELTAAGDWGRQPRFDAFWGARYAIVAGADGNDVGLMSPIDESRRSWPPEGSPTPQHNPVSRLLVRTGRGGSHTDAARRGRGCAKAWPSLNSSAMASTHTPSAAVSASARQWPSGVSAGGTAARSRSRVERSGSGSYHGGSNAARWGKLSFGSSRSAVHQRSASSRASHAVSSGRCVAAR
jgi:catechol 2,3-dioxygenase-like lactoylglutathione lyase family enzyme